ncbi:MAG: hypothetical protein ACI9U2_003463 [Bradymonadia bacterium]|jgi:hypothetical protein
MSRWTEYVLECPCGTRFGATLLDGLDAGAAAQREAILDGSLQRFTCPGCDAIRTAVSEMVYLDLPGRQMVMVAPPWRMGDHARYAALAEAAFDTHVRRCAPPLVQALADEFRVRLVFGLDALAERLRAWDAGLDDQLIEAVKVDRFGAQADRLLSAPVYRLIGVDKTAWRLTFAAGDDEQAEVDLDVYLRAEADRIGAEARTPEIFAAPFGGFDAWLVEVLAPAWARRPHFEAIGERTPEPNR